MSEWRSLKQLYAYNAWANALTFATCGSLDPSYLATPAAGTVGTIAETLTHLVGVEDFYVHLLRGEHIEATSSREAYFGHDLPWFAERAAQLGKEYGDLLAQADDQFYGTILPVTWFDFAPTTQEALLHVLNHSAQHRAQVLSALGARGQEVPNVDFMLFVQSLRAQTE
jgi:uncharacterized damage-inducible protein DinB